MHKEIKIIKSNKYKKNSKTFKLIEFINNHTSKIIEESISSISQKIAINTSTITRIVRNLGFKNYTNFRIFVVEKIAENKKQLIMQNKINKTNNSMQNFYVFNNFAIEETINNIDEKNFEKIIDTIVSSTRILLFGIGFAHSICHQLAKYFEVLNINSCHISDFYHALRIINNASNTDVWIIISISLTTKETVFLLKELTLNEQTKIIVITSNDKHTILKKVSHILTLKSLDTIENEIFNFNYKAALTAIANLLINSIINKINYDKIKQILEFNIKTKKWKKEVTKK